MNVYSLLIVKDKQSINNDDLEILKYLLEKFVSNLEKEAIDGKQDYLTKAIRPERKTAYTLIAAVKQSETKEYYGNIYAIDRKTYKPIDHVNASDLISLTRPQTLDSLTSDDNKKYKPRKIKLEEEVDDIIKNNLNELITDDKNKVKDILDSYVLSSRKGFIIGNIMPATKPDLKYNNEIYKGMLHYHNATCSDGKDYDFMTFDVNFGVAPVEIIQDEIVNHPEKINAELIKKTSIRVSKKNGIPLINGEPIKNFEKAKRAQIKTKITQKENDNTEPQSINIPIAGEMKKIMQAPINNQKQNIQNDTQKSNNNNFEMQ